MESLWISSTGRHLKILCAMLRRMLIRLSMERLLSSSSLTILDLDWACLFLLKTMNGLLEWDGCISIQRREKSIHTHSRITGKWSLKMDVIDIVCRRPFPVGDHTIITPIIGVKSSFIHQKVQVDYEFLSITYPNLSTPRSMLGLNRCWGVGPQIGVDVKMLLPKETSFVVGGVFSGMFGTFRPTTKYSNLTSECGDQSGAFWLKDTISRVFVVSQIQGAFSRTWQVNKTGSLEFVLGWECQVWWRQMRLDWYSTVVYPPAGSDLYLQGPFMRAFLTF